MKKVCIVTATRSEYGLLKPLIRRIKNDSELKLQLVVTGMHLSPEFGFTYKEILADGFEIDEKVEILLSSDTPVGISKSMGLIMISFTEVFERLKPDIIVILGDRYEMLSVASVAMVANIPIAHIHGGEITEGAIDDAIRHSITKMSFLHFASTEIYRKRIIQLGEDPSRVFNVGALGIENINTLKLLNKNDLLKELNIHKNVEYVMVTYHPVTLESKESNKEIGIILECLLKFKKFQIIITKSNADAGGRLINKIIDEYAEKYKDRIKVFSSLGQLRYLSSLKYCKFVIGNSSSGIIEAPSFNIPTINIGNRQKGRIQAATVINCRLNKDDIYFAIEKALSDSFVDSLSNIENPYGDGNVSSQIIDIIKQYLKNTKNKFLGKSFYDL